MGYSDIINFITQCFLGCMADLWLGTFGNTLFADASILHFHAKNVRCELIHPREFGNKKSEFWLDKKHNLPHQTKSDVLRCHLPSIIITMQKV